MIRTLLLFTLLAPAYAWAQLDRIRMNMTEAEFMTAFPEATRDFESEAYWTNNWDAVEGSSGNSLWRIVNDTVTEYSFRSLKMDGPSWRFTTVDSAKVHQLRVSAMQLEAGLEKMLGKPAVLRGKGLLSRPLEPRDNHDPHMQTADVNEIYFAQWMFDDGKVIVIRVSADLSTGNRINAAVNSDGQRSESYEFDVAVNTRRASDGVWHFEVGHSARALFSEYPNAQPRYAHVPHMYTMPDKEVAAYATWRFIFIENRLSEMYYSCVSGLGKDDLPADLIYNADRFRAQQLMNEGNKAFGNATVKKDEMPEVYEPSPSQVSYRKTYLQSEWKTESGPVQLLFEEMGGGKNGPARFSLTLNFTRIQ